MNIGSTLTRCSRIFPDHPAIEHGEKRRTYAQFNARANQLANALVRLGLRKGDHVALLMHNCPEMLEALYACFKGGFGAVPINFRLHADEYAYIIDQSQARTVVLTPEFNTDIRTVADQIPRVEHFIGVADAGEPFPAYETILSEESPERADADTGPEDVAWIFYTSGTTGRPKGAMLTHRNLLAMTLTYYADYVSLGPRDAILHAAPLSHGSGLYALPNIAQGATNVILETKAFEPERVFATIQEKRITNMFAAPTMLNMLTESPAAGKYDLGSMRSIIYGGGPMHVENLKAAMAKLGPCLTQLYGMGETPMTITYLPHRDHVHEGTTEQMKRLASAGISRTGVDVRIVDSEARPLPIGEMGEVVARSDVVMKGYWQNPEATAETLAGGWLHTGDLGYLDDQGYLFLMDRSKDMIISGGENIYPREVEEVLARHPAVREVAVIGVPDSKWGESVKAVVVRAPEIQVTESELIEFCKARLASYKKPKSVDFIDTLPKNNYGKIVKRALRDNYRS
ncbi:MAG: long-chain fatty acid--CoA ligase [Deltaproteobacteria bacterium]|nr:long-chain fatty acid--CoA ligase [Deltaproteobacteria bacterium]